MSNKSMKVNTIYNIIKTCSSVIFPLITFPYISRVLLPDMVGRVSFANTFVSYFVLIATLGVTVYAVRACSAVREDKQELSRVAGQIFSINICTTIASYVFLALSLVFLKPIYEYRAAIVIQSTIILFTTIGADWINSAMEDFKFITIRTIAFQILSLVLMFVFVKKPDDYLIYIAITALATSGANIINIFYRKRYCNIRFSFKIDWKLHFPPIVSLFVMQLAQIIYTSSEITMLGLIKGDYEVGIYTSASKIYTIASQVLASILWVVMPKLSLYFAKKDYKSINDLLRKTLAYIVAFGVPCTVGIAVLARDIMLIVGGEEYISAVPVLRILMLSLVFSLFGGTFIGNIIMLPSKREKTFMAVCIITAGVNILLNAVLIPLLGIYGTAISSAISALLIGILLLPKIEKEIKIERIESILLLPILGSAAIVAISVLIQFFVPDIILLRTVLTIAIGGMAYVAVLVLGKYEFSNNIIKAVLNRLKHR